MQQLKLKIVAEDKYMPKYANSTDACMDLKARLQTDIIVQPNETVKIKSGRQRDDWR